MIHIWNGILVGLALSILIGPILFTLIQRSIERGISAGISVGLGIWVSDLLFITVINYAVLFVSELITTPSFKPVIGVLGGLILMGIGTGMLVSNPAEKEAPSLYPVNSFGQLFLEGFLINTINPFTVIFWTSLITTQATDSDFSVTAAWLFFGSLLGTIIVFDMLKVLAAHKISSFLQPVHIIRMRKISGAALFLFGLAMMIRVWW